MLDQVPSVGELLRSLGSSSCYNGIDGQSCLARSIARWSQRVRDCPKCPQGFCSSVFSYSKEETDCLGPSHVHNKKEIEEFIKALPG